MNFALLLQQKLWQSAQQFWFSRRQFQRMAASQNKPAASLSEATRSAQMAGPLRSRTSLGVSPTQISAPGRRSANPPTANACNKQIPLRVRHVLECGTARGSKGPASTAGRYVISGRLADVCAELDRLAAKEAAMH